MIELLAILAVWRVTSLFANEEGPFGVFAKIREALDFDCFWCISVWVSAVIVLFTGGGVVNWLAFSAGAIILEELICLARDVRNG